MFDSGWQEEGCVCIECVKPAEAKPEERHEMRLLDRSTVYCLCGWAMTVEYPDLRKAELVLHELIERYREHLEDTANE